MRKFLIVLSVCFSLFIAGCGDKTSDTAAGAADVSSLPKFVLHEDDILSWEEGKDFVKVTLNMIQAKQFNDFTAAHQGEQIAIYLGSDVLTTTTIGTPSKEESVYLMGLSESDKDRIVGLMSSDKNAAH